MKRKKKHTKNKPPRHICEQYTDGLRQKVLDNNMPADAVLGECLVTLIGHSELWLENYKALLAYEEGKVLIQAGSYQMCVEGQGLIISHYMEEHMMIRGNIRSITYL